MIDYFTPAVLLVTLSCVAFGLPVYAIRVKLPPLILGLTFIAAAWALGMLVWFVGMSL